MPKHKIRQSILPMGGFTKGGFLTGTACMNAPSATGYEVVVGATLAITGVSAGDLLLISPNGSMTTTMVLKSACAIAGGISASFMNSASADVAASSDVVISYVVFS